MEDDRLLNEIIGNNIKAARLMRGLTQKSIGVMLGITHQQVQKYEKGFNRVSASGLYKISQMLYFPLEFFFTPHMELKNEHRNH